MCIVMANVVNMDKKLFLKWLLFLSNNLLPKLGFLKFYKYTDPMIFKYCWGVGEARAKAGPPGLLLL